MATVTKTMVGTVTGMFGRYFVVSCPDAPAHLRDLNLIPQQMMNAKVGDSVRVGYVLTTASGLWNVVEVL